MVQSNIIQLTSKLLWQPFPDQIFQAIDKPRMIVGAWNELYFFAAVLHEQLLVFVADLDERFQAVCNKCRTECKDRLHSFFPPLANDIVGKRLYPFLVQARLEANGVLIFREAKLRSDEPRCGVAGCFVAKFCISLTVSLWIV